MAVLLLVDNGSKRAAATLQLRQLAEVLSERVGQTVHPVSLQHSNHIDAEELDGVPAQIFSPFLSDQLEAGETEFRIIPMFFGVSRALTSFIPQQLSELTEKYGEFKCDIADVIYPLPQGDPRLSLMLNDLVHQTASDNRMSLKHVILVDHGSPIPEVTAVRQSVADELQKHLGDEVTLHQSVMERRGGKQYDFNGDLLEDILSKLAEDGVQQIVVAMMFFLPGRHAGAGGDIDGFCQEAMDRFAGLSVVQTPLLSQQPKLIDMLVDRANL